LLLGSPVVNDERRIYFAGYFIYDFFIGRELNPRVGGVDLKFFCELRPGLIGWVLLDLSFIVEALSRNSSAQVLGPLVLVTVFHALYVADALWHEVPMIFGLYFYC